MRRLVVVAIVVLALAAPLSGVAPAEESTGVWSAQGSGVTPISGMLIGGGGGGVPVQPAAVRPAKPGGIPATGKFIELSIAKQRLVAWENGRPVMEFAISTGRPGYRTPAGRFKVRAKGTRWWSRKWKVWMPYAMNFHRNYNLHSLPHARGSRRLIGASSLGRPASHGCVRIGPSNAKRLYSWTPVGTPVWIH
ncbi:MAG: L,D-transpeptidase [Actinomycetota bacterium]